MLPALLILPVSSQDYRITCHEAHDAGFTEAAGGIPGGRGEILKAGDSMQVYLVLKDLIVDERGEGFLAASLDSLRFDSLRVDAWIFKGPRFRWGSLGMDSIDRKILRKARIRTRTFSGKPVRVGKLASAEEKLLGWYEENGYPFAAIHLRDVRVEGQRISGNLWVESNGLFRIDTLHIKGGAEIEPIYLEKLCGIVSGDLYRESRISAIGDRIREIPFLEEIRPAEMEFFRGKVDVYTYLQKARANQFNGLVGVFPNYEQTGKLFVTGDLYLYLANSFGHGESFRFAWKALQPRSQELDLKVDWPYLFSSGVGTGVEFSLMKQDTSWITLNPVVDFRFFLGGANYFHVFYEYFNSSLIRTGGLDKISTLPPWADVSSSLYGVGIRYRNLDYLFNPRSGWELQARLGIGSRKVRINPALPGSVYESIALSTTKVRGLAELGYYLGIGSGFCIHLESRWGYLNSGDLFENELFRLGGLHTLRGTDENSIFASFYGLGTAEVRFLFERNSNFFVFFDGGYYEKDAGGEFTNDLPYGFGGGLNLSTRAGVFSLVYALGRQFNNPVNISHAKIHVGYLNRF